MKSLIRSAIGRLLRLTYSYWIAHYESHAEFPPILNARGLTGRGVELGVQTGWYSEQLLSTWRGETLYLVDPWKEFGDEYLDGSNVSQEEQEANLRETKRRVAPFDGRYEILRMTSKEAAQQFEDGSLDFVYLDAQHHYEAVREDLHL